MKQKLQNLAKIAFVAVFATIILSSCSGRDGIDGKDGLANWKIVNITVKSNEWEWDNAKKYYYANIDLPELSKYIYNNGAVISYVYIGKQNQDETMHILPFSEYVDGFKYTIDSDVSYDIGNGSAQFRFQWADLAESQPGTYNFKIVLMW